MLACQYNQPKWPGDLDLESGVRVAWATSVPILVFLGLSVLELGPMYATDRRQTDRCQTKEKHGLMPPPIRGGGIIICRLWNVIWNYCHMLSMYSIHMQHIMVTSNGMQLVAIYRLFTKQCATNFNITCFIETHGFNDFQGPQETNSITFKDLCCFQWLSRPWKLG